MNVVARLLQSGAVTSDLAAAIESAVSQGGASYEKALLEHGVPKEVVREALAQEFGVPAHELGEYDEVEQSLLSYLAEDSARHYRIMPIKLEDDVLLVGANNPDDLSIHDVLNFISSKHNIAYKFVFMLDEDLERAMKAYESLSGEVGEALYSLDDKEGAKKIKKTDGGKKETAKVDASHLKEDAPVTKIVATILRYAVDGSASDIHIEPIEEKVTVRFRVDGELQKSLELPKNVHSAVVARVKILSNMRLDEKRRPQDGRFSANFDGNKIDFRVSVLPTNHGEKVVMRILDNERGVTSLNDTGISPYHLDTIRRMLKEPFGIILISGPTGSGKSTTLYSMLGEVDTQTKNVMSLEDPVEYNIAGVSQSQVRPEIGYTFASGLRSALRQDPDIIMVGEIRDKETAQLAIQAALTGHLVFSTIHTNNSIGVIPRLIDMGVDPYLIAPTLKLAIAQRLARRLCPGTGKEVSTDGAVQMMIDKEFENMSEDYRHRIPQSRTIKHAESTPGCTSGTRGRVAVMEVFEVNDEVQELILKGGSEEEMFDVGRRNGFMSMKEDALIKALEHTIPYEEVNAFGTKVTDDDYADDSVVGNNIAEDFDETVDNQASIKTIDV